MDWLTYYACKIFPLSWVAVWFHILICMIFVNLGETSRELWKNGGKKVGNEKQNTKTQTKIKNKTKQTTKQNRAIASKNIV